MRHTHYPPLESPEAEVEQKLPSYTAGGIDSGYQGYARNARDKGKHMVVPAFFGIVPCTGQMSLCRRA